MHKFEVFCEHERFSGELKVYIFANEVDGSRSIITDLTTGEMKNVKTGQCIDGPTFTLGFGMSEPFMQAMANELHKMGIKAEEAPVLENELTATKYHLEDMRAMAFNDENLIINRRKSNEEEDRKG
jgi:hypothetical protein